MMTPTSRKRRPAAVASPVKHLTLRRSVQAPGLARSAMTELARELSLDGSLRQTLVLLVSEVVSNAVLHSRGPRDACVGLTAEIAGDALRVTVTDAGEGFIPSERDPERADGGYGLYLLEKAASRWGVEASAPTCVWFELPLAP
jgi:anti-sigma regulatory factor (Ser/Thr protein kinase)